MGELFGILVIAASALILFAVSSVQIAHRVSGPRPDMLSRTFILTELDDLPLPVVAGLAAAIALSSQIPVAYLLGLPGGELSAASSALLLIEVCVALAWSADLAGARTAVRRIARRSTTSGLARIGARRRRAA